MAVAPWLAAFAALVVALLALALARTRSEAAAIATARMLDPLHAIPWNGRNLSLRQLWAACPGRAIFMWWEHVFGEIFVE